MSVCCAQDNRISQRTTLDSADWTDAPFFMPASIQVFHKLLVLDWCKSVPVAVTKIKCYLCAHLKDIFVERKIPCKIDAQRQLRVGKLPHSKVFWKARESTWKCMPRGVRNARWFLVCRIYIGAKVYYQEFCLQRVVSKKSLVSVPPQQVVIQQTMPTQQQQLMEDTFYLTYEHLLANSCIFSPPPAVPTLSRQLLDTWT